MALQIVQPGAPWCCVSPTPVPWMPSSPLARKGEQGSQSQFPATGGPQVSGTDLRNATAMEQPGVLVASHRTWVSWNTISNQRCSFDATTEYRERFSPNLHSKPLLNIFQGKCDATVLPCFITKHYYLCWGQNKHESQITNSTSRPPDFSLWKEKI